MVRIGIIGTGGMAHGHAAAITVEFANEAVGSIVATRWATGRANSLTLAVHCDKGALAVGRNRRPGAGVNAQKNIDHE